jgi:hypothetical protein
LGRAKHLSRARRALSDDVKEWLSDLDPSKPKEPLYIQLPPKSERTPDTSRETLALKRAAKHLKASIQVLDSIEALYPQLEALLAYTPPEPVRPQLRAIEVAALAAYWYYS